MISPLKIIHSVFGHYEGAQITQRKLLYVNYFNKTYDVLSHEKLDFETLFTKAINKFNIMLIEIPTQFCTDFGRKILNFT